MAEATSRLTLDSVEEPAIVALEEAAPALRRVVLVGHPNVGKSVLFTALTSRYVTISNYPGTTVEVFRSRAAWDGCELELYDTPGINSLAAESEDERVTATVLQAEAPDLVVQVGDAKNLRRTLLLTAQLRRLRIPLVLVLNMMDECRDRGITIDVRQLEKLLGIPVVETVAIRGEGLDLLRRVIGGRHAVPPASVSADDRSWVESILTAAQRQRPRRERWSVGAGTLLTTATLLGALVHLENYLGSFLGWPSWAGFLGPRMEAAGLGETGTALFVLALGWLGPVLLPALWALRREPAFAHNLGVWARKPLSGLFILAVTVSLTYQLVGNLGAQVLVGMLEDGVFAAWVTPTLQAWIPAGFFHDLLVGPYGVISMGLAYGFAIVLPVVSTFFIAFSFLEDSGYLPRLSILSDRLLRAMGLHGKAFLPMVLGLGCVTMATMTTRILASKKERFIATLLLALGVPCSAQLGVILGITAGLPAGVLWIVFGTVFLQLVIVGSVLSRILPGEKSPFILELPPLRFPVWRNILRKTWVRVIWFVKEAIPLFALGALVLFTLDKLGLLAIIVRATEPVISGILGLPATTAHVFLMGFLRRDYGAAGLFDMAQQGLLTVPQVTVGLVVITLFVPCIANFLVMIKEQGWRNAALMVGFILVYALAVGGVTNWALRSTGIFG
ncbi:MAG: ferrous iron transport protein B [Acidobacteriota bacterium]